MAQTLLIIIALVHMCAASVHATSISTQSQMWSENLTSALAGYAKEHNGRLPDDLHQLSSYIDIERFEEFHLKAPINERFTLIKVTVSLASPKGNIVALINHPILEERRNEVGRYVILRKQSGEIYCRWENENDIKAAFVKAGIKLPTQTQIVEPKFVKRPYRGDNSANQSVSPENQVEVQPSVSTERPGGVSPSTFSKQNETARLKENIGDQRTVDSEEKDFSWIILGVVGIAIILIGSWIWRTAK
jgi:hypothetical protein